MNGNVRTLKDFDGEVSEVSELSEVSSTVDTEAGVAVSACEGKQEPRSEVRWWWTDLSLALLQPDVKVGDHEDRRQDVLWALHSIFHLR